MPRPRLSDDLAERIRDISGTTEEVPLSSAIESVCDKAEGGDLATSDVPEVSIGSVGSDPDAMDLFDTVESDPDPKPRRKQEDPIHDHLVVD